MFIARGIFKTVSGAGHKRVIALSSCLTASWDIHVRYTSELCSHQGTGSPVLRDMNDYFVDHPP